jgi:hypothetical protein
MSDRREESAPRRVEDVREEQAADRQRREAELGTSWTSVILGWLAALGASLILSGIVGAIVGGILAALGVGRMASRQGLKHGLLVPLLALIVTIVLAIIGGALGASFIDQLSGVTLPGPAGRAVQSVPQQGLTTVLSIGGILALLFPFIGGALGGAPEPVVGARRVKEDQGRRVLGR